MTIAERLREEARQKGIQEGIKKGIEKGIAEGIEKGVLRVASNMLASGIDHKTIMQFTGLTAQEIDQLRH
ncbi:MAG: Rpn family recombination-promoting nuclease/putative transposase [Paludibacterium sp.]|uniref:hypothetical protein n=1 Tax=Paludibacterium sp. TaxID=1917523 RepID=UPI0025FA5519|nr:hypothetical protein [Paludibacterium sp.]MBV8046170.1 Rpn family recombination-promoting nuclease/putative transposase [Paludibacterium sp.]MBV8648847.1 Rpn family recombination-promoting nuclease/putative transposase [Paludibacterium sp.]